MRARRAVVIAMLPAVLAAGCAATVSGSAVVATGVANSTAESTAPGTTPRSRPPTTPPTSTSVPDSSVTEAPTGTASTGTASTELSGTPVDRERFLADLAAANATVTSVRGAVRIDGPSPVLATFDATQDAGTVDDYAIDLSLEFDGEELPVLLVRVDGQLYLAGDVLLSGLGVSTTWLGVDPASPDPEIAALGEELTAVTGELGAGQLQQLQSALREVVEVGPAELEGPDGRELEVTHYQGLIDGSALTGLEAAPSDVPIDLYLDEQGRPVLTITTAQAGGDTITATVSIESYDDPITITAPDPADVTLR